jgi:hypothetical protein
VIGSRIAGAFGHSSSLELKTKELNNARMAMIGIAGMVVQELVSGGSSHPLSKHAGQHCFVFFSSVLLLRFVVSRDVSNSHSIRSVL